MTCYIYLILIYILSTFIFIPLHKFNLTLANLILEITYFQ